MTENQKMNNGAVEVKEPATAAQTQKTLYDQAISMVKGLVPWDKFREGTAGSGLSIFDKSGGRGTRLLKVVESKKGLRVEFNVEAVEPKIKELAPNDSIIYTVKEAKDKHMGTCRWIYTGTDLKVLKELVSASVAGFAPKVKEEKKEEKAPTNEATAPKATEAPKQPEKPVEPPKGNRQLSAKEMEQLKATKAQTEKGKETKAV
jgi:hypothetical protein